MLRCFEKRREVRTKPHTLAVLPVSLISPLNIAQFLPKPSVKRLHFELPLLEQLKGSSGPCGLYERLKTLAGMRGKSKEGEGGAQ
jgi:hypothetical protein